MSRDAVEEVLIRAIDDDLFRRRLLAAPADAVTGYELAAAERQAIVAEDLKRLLLALDFWPYA